jgi:hypothetical protein
MPHKLKSNDHTDEWQEVEIDLSSDPTVVFCRYRVKSIAMIEFADPRQRRLLGIERYFLLVRHREIGEE